MIRPDGATKKVSRAHWGTRVRTFESIECDAIVREEHQETKDTNEKEKDEDETECSPFSSMNSAEYNGADVFDSPPAGSQSQREEKIPRHFPRKLSKVKDLRPLCKKNPINSASASNEKPDETRLEKRTINCRSRNSFNRRVSGVSISENYRVGDYAFPVSDCANKQESFGAFNTQSTNVLGLSSENLLARSWPTCVLDSSRRSSILSEVIGELSEHCSDHGQKDHQPNPGQPLNRRGILRTASGKALKRMGYLAFNRRTRKTSRRVSNDGSFSMMQRANEGKQGEVQNRSMQGAIQTVVPATSVASSFDAVNAGSKLNASATSGPNHRHRFGRVSDLAMGQDFSQGDTKPNRNLVEEEEFGVSDAKSERNQRIEIMRAFSGSLRQMQSAAIFRGQQQ